MKNYFENTEQNRYVAFDKAIHVSIHHIDNVLIVQYSDNNSMSVEISHLDDYKQWLDLQYKKDLAVANPFKSIQPDHIEDKLGMVLTKEQIQSIARELLSEQSCVFCKLRYKRCDVCYEEFVPTDEFVAKINKLLEEK